MSPAAPVVRRCAAWRSDGPARGRRATPAGRCRCGGGGSTPFPAPHPSHHGNVAVRAPVRARGHRAGRRARCRCAAERATALKARVLHARAWNYRSGLVRLIGPNSDWLDWGFSSCCWNGTTVWGAGGRLPACGENLWPAKQRFLGVILHQPERPERPNAERPYRNLIGRRCIGWDAWPMEFQYGRSAFGRSGRSVWCRMTLDGLPSQRFAPGMAPIKCMHQTKSI